MYNQTAPATGSLKSPLNYALEPFSCHFELSRLPALGLGPPYVMSGTINIAIDSNAMPRTWSQNTPNSSLASTGMDASSTPESTASPTTYRSTVRMLTNESSTLSKGQPQITDSRPQHNLARAEAPTEGHPRRTNLPLERNLARIVSLIKRRPHLRNPPSEHNLAIAMV